MLGKDQGGKEGVVIDDDGAPTGKAFENLNVGSTSCRDIYPFF